MKRGVLVLFVFMAGFLFAAADAAIGRDIDIGQESIEMKTPEGKKPALFPHRFHQRFLSCLECHHVSEQAMTVNKCVTCHNDSMKNQQLNDLKKAAHARCRGCHKSVNDQGRKAPSKCGGCHSMKSGG